METEPPFSILGEYRYYFQILKVFGIFPFKITYDKKHRNVVKEVTFHKSGVYAWVNRLSTGILLLYCVFAIYINVKTIRSENPTEYLQIVGWSSSVSMTLAIYLSFNWRKAKLCTFFNHWIQLENSALTPGNLHLLELLAFFSIGICRGRANDVCTF